MPSIVVTGEWYRRPWLSGAVGDLHPGIEDTHLRPVGLVLLDEGEMPRVGLVGVVRRLVGEDDVQGDVVLAVVHGPGELVTPAPGGEEKRTGMTREFVETGLNQPLCLLGGSVDDGEVDVVGQWHRCSLTLKRGNLR